MRKIFTIINRGYISHRHLLGWNNDLSARFYNQANSR